MGGGWCACIGCIFLAGNNSDLNSISSTSLHYLILWSSSAILLSSPFCLHRMDTGRCVTASALKRHHATNVPASTTTAFSCQQQSVAAISFACRARPSIDLIILNAPSPIKHANCFVFRSSCRIDVSTLEQVSFRKYIWRRSDSSLDWLHMSVARAIPRGSCRPLLRAGFGKKLFETPETWQLASSVDLRMSRKASKQI